ncbi:MAG: hypothetical protein ACKO45_01760 [Cyanobium sp.]
MANFPFSKKLPALLLIAPVLAAGSAQAATSSCNLSSLGTCNVTLGNVTYSGFGFTGITPVGGDVFNLAGFSNGAGQVSLSFSPNRVVDIPSAQFTYTATLSGGLSFNKAQANLTGSTLGGGNYSTTLSAPQLPISATSTGGAGSFQNFTPGLTSQTFTQVYSFDFVNDPDDLASVGGSFTAEVPAPLPLFGAAAAFGFSRKLRSRIRSAS